MTVKQSETETFNPEASGDMLDASLDAIIAGTGQSADGLANGGKNGTPRPADKTPGPSSTPGPKAEGGAQTLLGIGTLGLPLPRGPFAAFEKKPAADDPDDDITRDQNRTIEEEPAPLTDPLAAQAAAHRDRALGRLPGVSAQPETPPPPSSAAPEGDLPDPGLTPPPPSVPESFATVSSADVPSVDQEEIEDAAPAATSDMIHAGEQIAARGQDVREIRSADLEFEGPDDGPTSLNPEIGQALEDADFFPSSFSAARPAEPGSPLFPTGAPRSATNQFPRLVTPPPDEIPSELAPFNLTLPPPGRAPGTYTPSALPSVGSPSQQMAVSLASTGSMLPSLPAALTSRGITKSRLGLAGAFVGCVLAGVLIDKAFFHNDKTTAIAPTPAVSTTPPPSIAEPAPPAQAPTAAATPSPTPTATPAPPAIVPVQATAPAPEPVKTAPVAPKRVSPPAEVAPPPSEEAPRPKPVAARPTQPAPVHPAPVSPPPMEPVAARPAPVRAAAAPKPTTPVKPPARPASRPKTKWVDPFAP